MKRDIREANKKNKMLKFLRRKAQDRKNEKGRERTFEHKSSFKTRNSSGLSDKKKLENAESLKDIAKT